MNYGTQQAFFFFFFFFFFPNMIEASILYHSIFIYIVVIY